MKKYIITDENRDDILKYMRARNYTAAKNTLNQLPELEDQES